MNRAIIKIAKANFYILRFFIIIFLCYDIELFFRYKIFFYFINDKMPYPYTLFLCAGYPVKANRTYFI